MSKEDALSREQAIEAMQRGEKVTHRFFTDEEYIIMRGDRIVDENDNSISVIEFWSFRYQPYWSENWSIFKEREITTPQSK